MQADSARGGSASFCDTADQHDPGLTVTYSFRPWGESTLSGRAALACAQGRWQVDVEPRSAKGRRTRARLLEAAKAVFERDGFLAARISDIAAEAEVSHGSFYHYFDSKE